MYLQYSCITIECQFYCKLAFLQGVIHIHSHQLISSSLPHSHSHFHQPRTILIHDHSRCAQLDCHTPSVLPKEIPIRRMNQARSRVINSSPFKQDILISKPSMLAHASRFHSYRISRHHFYNLTPFSLAFLLIILSNWCHSEPVNCLGIQISDNALVLRSFINLSKLLFVIHPHSYSILQHITQLSLSNSLLAFF